MKALGGSSSADPVVEAYKRPDPALPAVLAGPMKKFRS